MERRRSSLRANNHRGLGLLRLGALAAALALIGAGLAHGDPGSVMQKAVNICLECIGIG